MSFSISIMFFLYNINIKNSVKIPISISTNDLLMARFWS